MPIIRSVVCLTSDADLSREEHALNNLDGDSPTDEACDVSVGERQEDSWIHATITRRRKTLIWSDGWSEIPSDAPYTHKYEKTFEKTALTLNEIVESIARMIKAPEVPIDQHKNLRNREV